MNGRKQRTPAEDVSRGCQQRQRRTWGCVRQAEACAPRGWSTKRDLKRSKPTASVTRMSSEFGSMKHMTYFIHGPTLAEPAKNHRASCTSWQPVSACSHGTASGEAESKHTRARRRGVESGCDSKRARRCAYESTGNRRPATCSRQQAIGNRQQAAGSRQQGLWSRPCCRMSFSPAIALSIRGYGSPALLAMAKDAGHGWKAC